MIITTTNSIEEKEITSCVDIATYQVYSKLYDIKGLSLKWTI